MSKKWGLKRHRQQSPQFDTGIKHQNFLWSLGIIVSFILGIISQVFLFPLIFDNEPNMNIVLHDKGNSEYLLQITNPGDPIEDLRFMKMIPGVAENIVEYGITTNCDYHLIKQSFFDEKEYIVLNGQEIVSIDCQRMGSESHYAISFTLDESNFKEVIFEGQPELKSDPFQLMGCNYYIKGYNNQIRKYDCIVNIV